jgi:hypothetical protein
MEDLYEYFSMAIFYSSQYLNLKTTIHWQVTVSFTIAGAFV